MDEYKPALKKQYDQLPETIRKFVVSDLFEKKMAEIVRKNRLNNDQARRVENEIVMVILELENATGFVESLKKYTKIPEGMVFPVARDVNDHIFSVIKQMKGAAQTKKQEGVARSQEKTKKKKQKELRGVERSMPRDVARAKGTHIPREEKKFFERGGYADHDPYREPPEIENPAQEQQIPNDQPSPKASEQAGKFQNKKATSPTQEQQVPSDKTQSTEHDL